MIDETNTTAGNEAERLGFCQDCGRPLTRETVRPVGSGVFCEPCLEARIAAGVVPPASAAGTVPGGAVPPFQEPFPPISGDNPSPVLAALLGLIPGVGAMYNGQYAKGIAHILIYMMLQLMTNANGFFGILVAGWIFYQAFEAYHTAKARRDGLPLPDPFGLNNIGAQVGVHFRGTAQGNPGVPPTPPNAGGYPNWTGYVPPQAVVTPPPEPGAVPPAAWGGVPSTPYAQSAPYAPPVGGWEAAATPPPPAAAGQDWASTPGYYPVAPPVRRSNIPGAAAWLIGLGVVFLCINVLPEWRLSVGRIFPFLLMAFSGWLFYRRMSVSGGVSPAEGEGEAAYAQRAVCWLRMPVVLFTVALLWALQEFDVFRFGQSWPVLVIVIGVLMLLERSVGNRVVPVAPVVEPIDATNGSGKGI